MCRSRGRDPRARVLRNCSHDLCRINNFSELTDICMYQLEQINASSSHSLIVPATPMYSRSAKFSSPPMRTSGYRFNQ